MINLLYTSFLLKSLNKKKVVQDEIKEYLNLSQIEIKKIHWYGRIYIL